MNLIASVLHLDRKAVRELKIDGPYALHRVVYSLFTDVRSIQEKQGSKPSGFLYADLGGDFESRKILLLSNRSQPKKLRASTVKCKARVFPQSFYNIKPTNLRSL